MDWYDQTEARETGHRDFRMGAYHSSEDASINYIRRVRRCDSCGTVFRTGEISLELINELVRLRGTLEELKPDAERVLGASSALHQKLADL